MKVNITINDARLTVEKGLTILQAARENNIDIPTLCDYPGLPPHGSCRMCVIEIKGNPTFPTACTTPIEEGMVVFTDSPGVHDLRVEVLQMLLARHPTSCLCCPENENCEDCMVTLRKASVTSGCRSCPNDQQCELQNLVDKLGLEQIDYPLRYRGLKVYKNDPFFDRDYNLCVLCGRCIRVCKENHFLNILSYTTRGSQTLVGTPFGQTQLEAGCTFCGACVEACPTGALSEKTRKWDGKPETETITTCVLCSIGCQMRLLSKHGMIIGSLPDHQSGNGSLCVKGRFGITELANTPQRLKQPRLSNGQHFTTLSWDESIRLAAEKCVACPPEAFGMLISPNCSNEELYVAQKFTRKVMKSQNIRTTLPAIYRNGFKAAVNLLKNSQSRSILRDASAILCLGLDAKYAQSVIEVDLHKAKAQGAKIMAIDPWASSLNDFADEALQPRLGQELAILQQLVELTGSDKTGPLSHKSKPDRAVLASLKHMVKVLNETPDPILIVGPSFLTHPENHQLLVAIETLIHRLNARIIVLPAESNLLGSLLMGVDPELLPGGKLNPKINDISSQPLDVLYLIGEKQAEPSHKPGFVIYQNSFSSPDVADVDLSLPAASFGEYDGTTIRYDGRIQAVNQAVAPPGEALPSWQILCKIAQAMGYKGFDFASIQDIQDEIAGKVIGFRVNDVVDRSKISTNWVYQSPGLEPANKKFHTNLDHRFILSTRMTEHSYSGFPLTTWVEGLQSIYPEDCVCINPTDAREAGISQGTQVSVSLPFTQVDWPAHIDPRQPQGILTVVMRTKDQIEPGDYLVKIRVDHV